LFKKHGKSFVIVGYWKKVKNRPDEFRDLKDHSRLNSVKLFHIFQVLITVREFSISAVNCLNNLARKSYGHI
jgi:hypothetical protein